MKIDMIYICVRTYGNGKYMNKVFNQWFEYLSQAEWMCKILNQKEADDTNKWIPMPLDKYIGEVWE